MKKQNYAVPLMLVFTLFFLWAISSNLLPTMIRQLMKTCELNTFEASFTETAYWLAYFIFPIPIAMFMKRYSYKAGIVFGLLLAAFGGLLFFPAAMLKEYWAYLCIFFIIATGMCFLETAANPYVTALGDPATAPRRLNLAQSFNGLGAFISAMFLSKLILSGTHYTRETLPADYAGGWEAYIQTETDAMKMPYLVLSKISTLLYQCNFKLASNRYAISRCEISIGESNLHILTIDFYEWRTIIDIRVACYDRSLDNIVTSTDLNDIPECECFKKLSRSRIKICVTILGHFNNGATDSRSFCFNSSL